MNSVKPIKLAMMTCNHGHARGYYEAFCHHPDFEPVAYSIRPDYRDRLFLEKLPADVPCYEDDEQMLNEHPEIEAVILSSENDQHLKQMRLCAERLELPGQVGPGLLGQQLADRQAALQRLAQHDLQAWRHLQLEGQQHVQAGGCLYLQRQKDF